MTDSDRQYEKVYFSQENVLLDLMYELPGSDVNHVLVTKDV